MSGRAGPAISKDGLVLCLDSSDFNSKFDRGYLNIIDSSTWTVGSASSVGTTGANYFAMNGAVAENNRNWGTDPFGNTSMLWNCTPSGDGNADGGWNGGGFTIDNTKMYRYSVWVRRSVKISGHAYWGLSGYPRFRTSVTKDSQSFTVNTANSTITSSNHGLLGGNAIVFTLVSGSLPGGITAGTYYYQFNVSASTFQISTNYVTPVTITSTGSGAFYYDGNLNNNPYFQVIAAASFTQGSWYLIVGHVWPFRDGQGSNHVDTGTWTTSGVKLVTPDDFVWSRYSTTTNQRAYLYYTSDSSSRQEFFNPRVDVIDGTQPTLQELLSNSSNKVKDLSGTGNSFNLINSPLYTNNKGFVFNGYSNHIILPNSINAVTVISYVSLTAADGGRYAIYTPGANGLDNWLGVNNNKVELAGAEIVDINVFFLAGNTTLVANKFYQIVSVINGTTAKIYLNGVEDGTVTQAFTIGSWNSDATIGRRGSAGTFYFKGTIGIVEVYNRVLSAGEILDNYNSMKGRFGLT